MLRNVHFNYTSLLNKSDLQLEKHRYRSNEKTLKSSAIKATADAVTLSMSGGLCCSPRDVRDFPSGAMGNFIVVDWCAVARRQKNQAPAAINNGFLQLSGRRHGQGTHPSRKVSETVIQKRERIFFSLVRKPSERSPTQVSKMQTPSSFSPPNVKNRILEENARQNTKPRLCLPFWLRRSECETTVRA